MPEHFISPTDAESNLLSCAAYLAERITSIDGHAEAMTAVVPLYLQNQNVDLAAELSNTIDDPYTRDRLLTLVAEQCAEEADDEYALQLADAVEDHGLRSQAFERVALRQAARGEFDRARQVAGSIDHFDGVLTGIAVNESARGLEDAAMKTLSEVTYAGAAVTALHEMALHELAANNAEKAVEFLEKAVERAGDIEHTEEKARAYSDIGSEFIEAGRNDRAVETFDKAKSTAETIDSIHRDVFLSLAAQGFLRAGSLDLADRTLDLVKDKTQMASALLGHSREFWRKDERDEALDALEESFAILSSQHERETRDSRAKFRLFTQIAAQFAGFEKGERAIEIAEGIKDETERTSALTQVAAILTLRKEDDEARHAVRSITDDGDRVFALIGMSDAKDKNGERSSAIALLNEATVLADAVPQLTFRAAAYNEIGRRFATFGEAAQATDVFLKSLHSIAEVRDSSSQAVALAGLAKIAAETGGDIESNEAVRAQLRTLASRASR
jgi:tetratricopeptide (TPR) repeat protein